MREPRRGRLARFGPTPAIAPVLFAATLALALAAPARAQSPPAMPVLPDTTAVILLGTGMPVPNHAAQGPATAVVAGGRLFVFDAGPGVMRQIEAAGLPYRGGPITALFLTHLHSDHTLGYPDVIFTSWVMGRRAPLRVVGPPGTRRMTAHLVEAWREDIDMRTNGRERNARGGWRVDVRETRGGVVYDSAGVVIRAIPVAHGSWKYAFGYRIDAPGKSVVISGDTAPCKAIEEAARGVDVLVHEVYPEARLKPEDRPGGGDWVTYMRSFHTSDRELGVLAARAMPRTLVLYHVVRMGGTDEEMLAAIRAGGYGGNVVIGHDLERQ